VCATVCGERGLEWDSGKKRLEGDDDAVRGECGVAIHSTRSQIHGQTCCYREKMLGQAWPSERPPMEEHDRCVQLRWRLRHQSIGRRVSHITFHKRAFVRVVDFLDPVLGALDVLSLHLPLRDVY
jgi:hypothetical protein